MTSEVLSVADSSSAYLPRSVVVRRPPRLNNRKLQAESRTSPPTQVHSKRLPLALILVCATVGLTGCGTSVSGKVANVTGNTNADCSFTGRMLVGGTSEKVYQCSDKRYDTTIGCYAIHGDEVADVSKPFQSLIKLQGQTIDCGF